MPKGKGGNLKRCVMDSQLSTLNTQLLAQLPAVAAGDIERWLASAVAVGGVVLVYMRLTGRKVGTEYVSREEFREFRSSVAEEMAGLRDRIDSRHLALVEAIEKLQASLLSENERRDATLHRRLAEMEAGLARLDERTKKS